MASDLLGGPAFDLHLRAARISDGDPVSIGIHGGRLHYVGPVRELAATTTIEADGCAVIPGLLEPHVHLDKVLLDGRRTTRSGTLEEAMRITAELKRQFTWDEMWERASLVAHRFARNGTTTLRAHTDVDPIVGTLGIQVLLDLKKRMAQEIDLQVVAFPQEGILNQPGTLELLEESLDLGADVVGGCPYAEDDLAAAIGHLELVFGLAVRRDLPLDLHADFADDTTDSRFALAETIARATLEHGLQGRVTIGHATSLDALDEPERGRVFDALAEADVAVVALPATDLHLGGRDDRRNMRRGLAPLKELARAGVRVGFSTNNVRNAFTPYGNADTLETALLLAQTAHYSTPHDLDQVLRMATVGAASIMGVPDAGALVTDAPADLVVLEAPTPTEALLSRAPRRLVMKEGAILHGPDEPLPTSAV